MTGPTLDATGYMYLWLTVMTDDNLASPLPREVPGQWSCLARAWDEFDGRVS
jgi:hypothetical protein